MTEVAERYGFPPNRAGFIRCPFHAGDNSASLKIYPGKGGGFFCFGCQTSGSVIDFVMRVFDCPFKEAAQRLNSDFDLGLYRQTYREKKAARAALMAKQRALRAEEERKEEAEQKYWLAYDLWLAADLIQRRYNPSVMGGQIIPGYVEAVKSLPQLSYELTLAEERRREFDNTSRYSRVE
jgi:hypothetical protein